MAALRANDQLANRTTPTSYGWSDILIEQLAISRDEYRLFTDSTLQLGDLYGLPDGHRAGRPCRHMSLQDFSRRLGVSYDDLAAIIQTQFINPNAALIPRLQRLNAPFTTLQDAARHPEHAAVDRRGLHQRAAGRAGRDAVRRDQPDRLPGRRQLGHQPGRSTSGSWTSSPSPTRRDTPTTARAPRCSSGTPTRTTPPTCSAARTSSSSSASSGSGTSSRRCSATPATRSTIEQTDDILAALYPAADLPADPGNAANDAANRPLLDAGFADAAAAAGFLFQVMSQLSLTADTGLDQLLACWAPIGTVGPGSLYQAMFLTPTLLQQDPGAQTATVAEHRQRR